jgi:hypothetical protein
VGKSTLVRRMLPDSGASLHRRVVCAAGRLCKSSVPCQQKSTLHVSAHVTCLGYCLACCDSCAVTLLCVAWSVKSDR